MIMTGNKTWDLGTLDKAPHHAVSMALCPTDGDHTGILWVGEDGVVMCRHNNTGSYKYSGNMRIPLK